MSGLLVKKGSKIRDPRKLKKKKKALTTKLYSDCIVACPGGHLMCSTAECEEYITSNMIGTLKQSIYKLISLTYPQRLYHHK